MLYVNEVLTPPVISHQTSFVSWAEIYQLLPCCTELQKASNLPPGKVGLSKLKIRMNLENELLFFFTKKA